MCWRRWVPVLVVLSGAGWAGQAASQDADATRVRDVIYGRQHGVVLTMDVLRPAKPNGLGILFIVSGGWFSSHESINPGLVRPATDRGYTVFAVVHGSQPKYTIPEIVQDVDRATRFVRHTAQQYGVDPERLGISGGSAGGHLSLMQAVRGSDGKADAKDPVDRQHSRVQAVACFFPPTDFLNYGEPGRDVTKLPIFQPFLPAFGKIPEDPAERAARSQAISPAYHVSSKTPPTLIIHGDADLLVPIQQSQLFMKKLEEAGVPHELVVRPGKAHGWPTLGEDVGIFVDWFDKHLKK